MSNEVRGGGESGAHFRHDGLLNITAILADLSFLIEPSCRPSTSNAARQDATLGFGCVPLVHVVETRENIMPGVEDLTNKLSCIPNVSSVPLVFGIAISAAEIHIWKLTNAGMTDERPIFQSLLSSDLEWMNAVVAIVYFARVLKYYSSSDLMHLGSGRAFNVWHIRRAATNSLQGA